ncbi:PREDICTED: uncharacterized protein LOC109581384 [Amphimedon queenslandica]|uniref:Uncharacterized protein n=1 Tax=Amphimedon queenslandica TaxID=400682 RepID=A0A1X7V2V3_AMPQE|nr:PREDICTED: uncharacterized protein LOC109581384 [Amphimedon queenslandica]|eukprot:XP_019851005.1 PREDICTED: uncharacterized protein LOC109581384 [Amphimedon queenslandica]
MEEDSKEGLSLYELKRLKRIKENQALLAQLFPEGTKLKSPTKKKSKTKGQLSPLPIDPLVSTCIRRKSKRISERASRRASERTLDKASCDDHYTGPITRSRKILLSESLIQAKRRRKSKSNNVDHDPLSRIKAIESDDSEQDDGPETTKRSSHMPEDPLTRDTSTPSREKPTQNSQ